MTLCVYNRVLTLYVDEMHLKRIFIMIKEPQVESIDWLGLRVALLNLELASMFVYKLIEPYLTNFPSFLTHLFCCSFDIIILSLNCVYQVIPEHLYHIHHIILYTFVFRFKIFPPAMFGKTTSILFSNTRNASAHCSPSYMDTCTSKDPQKQLPM